MRKLTLALALVVGLIGFSTTAQAGIVDITLNTVTGDLTLRTDVGIDLISVGMSFNGSGGGDSLNILAAAGVSAATSLLLNVPNLVAQLNPPAVVGAFVTTGGATIQVGTFSNPGAVTSFDCTGCLSFFGGGVVQNGVGDITASTMYILIPEPAALALLGLGLAGLAFVRRSAA